MIQVENGKVVQTILPETGYLRDGRSVSNYHCLPEANLMAEGWLPENIIEPAFDTKTQCLVFDKYEIGADNVSVVYRVEAMPAPVIPETSETEELKQILIEKQVLAASDFIAVAVEE